MILFGIANLPDTIHEMRHQGWVIESRTIPYATAVQRINKHAVLQPPANLPVREIHLTEYWVNSWVENSVHDREEFLPGYQMDAVNLVELSWGTIFMLTIFFHIRRVVKPLSAMVKLFVEHAILKKVQQW